MVSRMSGTGTLARIRRTGPGTAKPRTGWLAGQLVEDSHGFLLTDTDIPVARLDSDNMNPLFLETSRPGIFAVGDLRSGSVKRAAAAIGEGSMRCGWSSTDSSPPGSQTRSRHRPT